MNPADFVAVVRLTNRAGDVLAAAGASCERVPADSLGWLLEQGLIRRAEPSMRPRLAKPVRKEE